MIDTKKLPRPQVPVESDPYRERARIKRTLAASFRLFAHYGFEQGVMGHISARDPIEPETIWMNSFAQGFATITADSLLRVNFSGRIVEGEGHVHPGGINTHVGIYQANRHLNGVAHAHTDHSIAWSALDKTFEPISAESAALYGKHALYDTYAHGEGEQLARIVETNRVVIFRSHGIFTAGESVEEAVYLFILADKVSHVHLLVEATGKAPVRIPPDIAQAISRNNDASKSRLNFQPYLQAALARWPDLNK